MVKLGKHMPYEIKIVPSHNKGFKVFIGCGVFVYAGVSKMLDDLQAYLDNPIELAALYEKEFGGQEVAGGSSDAPDAPDAEVAPPVVRSRR